MITNQILLAECDPSVRKMVGRVLESAGYSVLSAGTGLEAASLFEAGRPDLVILDLGMVEREGWEAFGFLQPIDCAVPVIAMTAWPNQSEQFARKGIAAVMEKPLDLTLLLRNIESLLAEAMRDRQLRNPRCPVENSPIVAKRAA